MRDAMAAAAAVFEPEEVVVLGLAYRLALKKLSVAPDESIQAEMARLVHNLARSRIRLKKPLRTDAHAVEVANEAVELFSYLEEAPETVLAASREMPALSRSAERIVGAFPREFRDPPVNRL